MVWFVTNLGRLILKFIESARFKIRGIAFCRWLFFLCYCGQRSVLDFWNMVDTTVPGWFVLMDTGFRFRFGLLYDFRGSVVSRNSLSMDLMVTTSGTVRSVWCFTVKDED